MRPSGPLATACALACAAPPAGATLASRPEVLVVQAPNQPASTLGVMRSGRLYTVTVTGQYTYDRAFALADCGHKDPAGPNSWIPHANLKVDGNVAQCVVQPFTPTHTYQWVQPGTGRPFVFEIVTQTDDDDDTGALVVTVVQV